ncbi:hypothetical protein [Halobacillus aidingensis]|uniref:Replication terminator protein n=1 Tax=Halobacillus aidingensis TaxID=240303 RepID=A0A1H0MK30_HALAD|nr:hypothetical protein [Halobacillus aidingensis]SDO80510.1 hypothetical protein SAMN05421677_10856 [Halobacillus aidingensis]
MSEYQMKLSEIADGALQEQFDVEHQRVVDNMFDRNTKAKAKRKITIELEYVPNEQRELANMTLNVKSKLAPADSVPTSLMIGADGNGQVVGKELRSGIRGQTYFEEDSVKQDDGEKIYEFKKSTEK